MATRKIADTPTTPVDVVEPVSDTSVTLTDDGQHYEITYSRSWDIAPVQYEKMSLFTSIKTKVPVDSDLSEVGEGLSDKLNELQGADLNWAKSLCTNKGSLINRIIP